MNFSWGVSQPEISEGWLGYTPRAGLLLRFSHLPVLHSAHVAASLEISPTEVNSHAFAPLRALFHLSRNTAPCNHGSIFFCISNLHSNSNLSCACAEHLLAAAEGLPWPALAFMGLATTAFTLSVEMHALKSVSSPLAALIYTAEPLWGALFAWVLLGERWGPTGWAGAALIIASTLAAQFLGGSEKTKEA